MAQNRLFYACQAVGLGDYGSAKYVEGVQSVGINTTIDFEQAFELGVITLYDNMEGTPSVEFTLERNLVSGVYPLWTSMAALAGEQASPTYTVNSHEQVIAVGSARPTAVLQVYKETTSYAGNTDTSSSPTFYVELSGLYVTNYSVTVGLDGSPTESMSFVGNDYKWYESGTTRIANTPVNGSSLASSGVVFRKQDIKSNTSNSLGLIPISGCVSGSGLQSVGFSMEFGREDLFELGRKTPYFKSATYPVEVTAEIEFIDTGSQDPSFLAARENSDGYGFKASATSDITSKKPIGVALQDMVFYMGSGRLTGTGRSGGDASGGNATITYSFQNFNYFHATGIPTHYRHYSKIGNTTAS